MTRISVAAILSCSIVLASVERLPAQEAQGSEAAATNFPIPPNLVIDLRLFESRTEYPDDEAMDELRFFIQSDGRSVTADQWLSTVAKKVPDTFLAALGYDTVHRLTISIPRSQSSGVRFSEGRKRMERSPHPSMRRPFW